MKLYGSLDMNDVKKEDAMRYSADKQGTVEGIAVIADGASGFHKTFDKEGNIVPLPDIVEDSYTSARIWAELLAIKVFKNAQNGELELFPLLKKSIEDASNAMKDNDIVDEQYDAFQIPSATIIMARLNKGCLEVVGSGDACMLVEYEYSDEDGREVSEIDTITGSKVLTMLRERRSESLLKEYPNYHDLSKDEQAKVDYKRMMNTRSSMGNEDSYFVPFLEGHKKMDNFLGDVSPVEVNQIRARYDIKNGDFWVMYAKAENVKSFMISSDGFIDRALRQGLISSETLIKKAKEPGFLDKFGKILRNADKKSNDDKNALVLKKAHGKTSTGSADDAVALYFEVNKPCDEAEQERQGLDLQQIMKERTRF